MKLPREFEIATEIEENDQVVVFDTCDLDDIGEFLMFPLASKNSTVLVGVTTVLKLLKVAEEQGFVGKLSDDWWLATKIECRR